MKLAMFLALALAVVVCLVPAYAEDGELIFSDDFSLFDPAWGATSEQIRVENQKMLIQAEVNTSYTSLYQGTLFGDADIRVKLAETSGQTDMPAGVAFWGNGYDNFYVAEFTTDGKFSVWRKMGQGRWLAPVGWQDQAAVKKGLNQENELRVVTKGNMATIYINGIEAASFKGFPPEGGGMVGLHAESGSAAPYIWAFSDFSVRKVK